MDNKVQSDRHTHFTTFFGKKKVYDIVFALHLIFFL